jgi:hypothetical protein
VIDGYVFQLNTATLVPTISRFAGGSSSEVLVTGAAIADPGSAYTMRAEADGPYLTFKIGPQGGPYTTVATAVDGLYYYGNAGVRDTAIGTSTTGRQSAAVRAGNQ